MASRAPQPLTPRMLGVTAAANLIGLTMKIASFAGHREEKEALVLSVAGVMAIMLLANLILLILY